MQRSYLALWHITQCEHFPTRSFTWRGLLVCDWLHSVRQNHFYIMLLFNQGYYYIQSLNFGYVLQEDSVQNPRQWSSNPLHPFERRGILFGRSSVKQHPSRRWDLSTRTPICIQKLQTVPGCIHSDVLATHPNVSATRPNAFQCSTSKRISFPNTDIGRQLQPSEQHSYSVWTLSLIRQDVQKSCNPPDAQSLLWKLRAIEVQPSRRESI